MTDQTEAQTIVDAATRAAVPADLAPNLKSIVVPTHEDVRLLDLQAWEARPRRKTGEVRVDDLDSLLHYLAEQATDDTAVFASETDLTLTAVINDHGAQAGWGDHRCVLRLQHTPEWVAWRDGQGLHTQTVFAEFLEEWADLVVEPAAADLIELAQTFQANTKVAFRSATRLASGQRQLTYEETIDARAGEKGSIKIPERFTLGLAPFRGAEAYKVEARLRYRINDGVLTIGYKLQRPESVIQDAFGQCVDAVAAVNTSVYRGRPAGARGVTPC